MFEQIKNSTSKCQAKKADARKYHFSIIAAFVHYVCKAHGKEQPIDGGNARDVFALAPLSSCNTFKILKQKPLCGSRERRYTRSKINNYIAPAQPHHIRRPFQLGCPSNRSDTSTSLHIDHTFLNN